MNLNMCMMTSSTHWTFMLETCQLRSWVRPHLDLCPLSLPGERSPVSSDCRVDCIRTFSINFLASHVVTAGFFAISIKSNGSYSTHTHRTHYKKRFVTLTS